MDRLRTILGTISAHLGGLTTTHKLLIGSLAVIAAMALFLVAQYAGTPDMVELLPGAPAEAQQRAMTFLQTRGITPVERNGQVVVPATQQRAILAQMSEAGQLPSDTALIFENMLSSQSWLRSKEENRQLYKVMLMNELEAVLSRYAGIRSAEVFLDIPEPAGLGVAVRRGTASVTLHTELGQPLAQHTVDAAARMVAGSIAGIDLDAVTVIDGSTGRAREVTSNDALASSAYQEHASALEKLVKAKIANLVSHIEGVVVEVTAAVDVTQVHTEVRTNLPVGQGSVAVPKRETVSSQSESQASPSAEPGLRANVMADINTGPGGGVKVESKDEETEFEVGIGTRSEVIRDPRGMPKRLMATINVPRAYIAALAARSKAAGPDGDVPAPTDDEIRAVFEQEREAIADSVRVHLKTVTPTGDVVDGDVVVAMVAGPSGGFGATAGRAGAFSPGGVSGAVGTIMALGGGVADKAVLIVLSVLALGMMFLMVRKAGAKVELPSAQELVGIPPALEATTDLVGEADETDTAILGIEVGDDTVKAQKLLEQVNELVKNSPDQAGRLMTRWIQSEN